MLTICFHNIIRSTYTFMVNFNDFKHIALRRGNTVLIPAPWRTRVGEARLGALGAALSDTVVAVGAGIRPLPRSGSLFIYLAYSCETWYLFCAVATNILVLISN